MTVRAVGTLLALSASVTGQDLHAPSLHPTPTSVHVDFAFDSAVAVQGTSLTASDAWSVYFSPYDSPKILKLDAATTFMSTIDLPSAVTATAAGKYRGATAVGTRVFFCPANADFVTWIDTTTDTAFAVAVPATVVGTSKYAGAANVGNRVFCAPLSQSNVLVVDATTPNNMKTVAAATTVGTSKWFGAAVVGTRVYFAPYEEVVIGVLETAGGADTWDSIALPTTTTGTAKFEQLATIGTKVYFSPNNVEDTSIPAGPHAKYISLLMLETTTNEITSVPEPTNTTENYRSVVPYGGKLFYGALNRNDILVLDAATLAVDHIDTSALVSGNFKYADAINVPGTNQVFFTPMSQRNVGQLQSSPFSPPPITPPPPPSPPPPLPSPPPPPDSKTCDDLCVGLLVGSFSVCGCCCFSILLFWNVKLLRAKLPAELVSA